MKILDGIKSLLSSKGDISSKRVCGILGWLVCLVVLVYCTIHIIQAPVMVDAIIVTSATLLGIDSVTNIWKNTSKKKKEEE